jgi:hypothetical protein
MLNFIRDIPALLESQGETLYTEHVQSLLNEKSTPDVSAREQSMRFWAEIVDRRMHFSCKQEQIDFFEHPPSLHEFIGFSSNLLIPSAMSNVRSILVQCSSEFEASKGSDKKSDAFVHHPLFAPIADAMTYVREPSELHEYSILR